MSLLMQRYLLLALGVLGVLMLLALLYAVLGKRFTDKIVAANMIGTLGVNMIVILAIFIGADYILDVGLVFALLSFLMVIVLCRFVQNKILHSLEEERQRAEKEAEREAGEEKEAEAEKETAEEPGKNGNQKAGRERAKEAETEC